MAGNRSNTGDKSNSANRLGDGRTMIDANDRIERLEQGFGDWVDRPVAVLTGGGLDSAVLIAECARRTPTVVPVFIRGNLVWETAEIRALERFLTKIDVPNVETIRFFDLDLRSIYGRHWSVDGVRPPEFWSADEEVYLPGRNLLISAQAMIWCGLIGLQTIVSAPLAGNPFRDSSPEFYSSLERTVEIASGVRVELKTPFRNLDKADVIVLGRDLPLNLTMSCLNPPDDRHCGRCSKCRERRLAFAAAGVDDRTVYVERVSLEVGAECSR